MTGWTVLVGLHAATAASCLLLGGYQLARHVKGDTVHRITGWLWVAGMLFAASSSFAIRDLRHGRLSLLHVLSVVTLISLIVGIHAVRHGDIGRHRAAMRGSWLGLVGAFIGAIAVPTRRIPTFAVTDPLGATIAAVVIVVLSAGLIAVAHTADRLRTSRPDQPRGPSQPPTILTASRTPPGGEHATVVAGEPGGSRDKPVRDREAPRSSRSGASRAGADIEVPPFGDR